MLVSLKSYLWFKGHLEVYLYKTIPNSLTNTHISSEVLLLPLIWLYMLSQACCWPREVAKYVPAYLLNE